MGPIAFPYKLWEIVEQWEMSENEYPNLIRWNMDGRSIIVDTINFETYVALRYPRFLRRSTLDCLQKQLYQYKFEIAPGDYYGILQYWHPCFLRGRADLLVQVTSRQIQKPKQVEQPKEPLDWVSNHQDQFSNTDHCSDSYYQYPEEPVKHSWPMRDEAVKLDRPINRSTKQYKFWRRTGRIAAFPEPSTYDRNSGDEMSLGHGDRCGDAPALLDFLHKTSTTLKQALKVDNVATSSGKEMEAPAVNSIPKVSWKVSIRNPLQFDTRFMPLSTMIQSPQPILIPYPRPLNVNEIASIQQPVIVIAPVETPVAIKTEPVDDVCETEMYSTSMFEEEEVAAPTSGTPPFAMLNIPRAIKVEPDGIHDDWFAGEVRAYYSL